MLRESEGYLSGQQLCEQLGVSRTAVWKTIGQLKEEGYQIQAVRNKGYRLVQGADVITRAELVSSLDSAWAGSNLVYYDRTDSTNTRARQLAEQGAPHGTLVVADSQTAGKGRRGRHWEAPDGTGIWMTLILRPELEPQRASMLTLVTALAVADAILKSGADTVALAGYMRMLTAGFLNAFPHRVVNVHPALLPSFPGIHGAADAQAWGVKITGCTVHLVDEIMDHGEVIIQAAVPAIAGEPLDDLQSRIHAQEHRIYPQALQWLAEDRIKMDDDGRSLHLLPGSRPLAAPAPGVLVSPPLEEGF